MQVALVSILFEGTLAAVSLVVHRRNSSRTHARSDSNLDLSFHPKQLYRRYQRILQDRLHLSRLYPHCWGNAARDSIKLELR